MSRKAEISAGILPFRRRGALEVLLAHPGGPYWAKKDAGAWTIAKGLADPDEELLATAQREFTEETGFVAREPFIPLSAGEAEERQDRARLCVRRRISMPASLVSNTFEIEWPPKSGKRKSFPEIDRVAWFGLAEAREKILTYQLPFLDELEEKIVGRMG